MSVVLSTASAISAYVLPTMPAMSLMIASAALTTRPICADRMPRAVAESMSRKLPEPALFTPAVCGQQRPRHATVPHQHAGPEEDHSPLTVVGPECEEHDPHPRGARRHAREERHPDRT